jgi:hypothetical protein
MEPNGDSWLIVTAIVDDAQYLNVHQEHALQEASRCVRVGTRALIVAMSVPQG